MSNHKLKNTYTIAEKREIEHFQNIAQKAVRRVTKSRANALQAIRQIRSYRTRGLIGADAIEVIGGKLTAHPRPNKAPLKNTRRSKKQ